MPFWVRCLIDSVSIYEVSPFAVCSNGVAPNTVSDGIRLVSLKLIQLVSPSDVHSYSPILRIVFSHHGNEVNTDSVS